MQLFEELLINPQSNSKYILWNYFVQKNIVDPGDCLIYTNKNNNNSYN